MEGYGPSDTLQRIRLAQRMLTDAGYATRVIPPLPPRPDTPPVTDRDWTDLESRLVTATAGAFAATTADEVLATVLPLMDPESGLVARMTALLDTAADRLANLAPHGPATVERTEALRSASTALAAMGYRIAEADLAPPSAEERAARAAAALTRSTLPVSGAEPSPSAAPASAPLPTPAGPLAR